MEVTIDGIGTLGQPLRVTHGEHAVQDLAEFLQYVVPRN